MPTNDDYIGRIVPTGSETWQWEIPDFSRLPKETGVWFWSPAFHLSQSRWNLRIFPNGVRKELPAIHLRLVGGDCGRKKTVHCTLGVKKAGGVKVTLPTQIGKIRMQRAALAIWECYKSEFKENEFLSSGTFTLTLHLKMQGEAAPQGRTFFSTGTQTDVLHTVTEEENGHDRYTSPEAKGVAELSKHIGDILTEGEDYDVKIMVKDKIFQAHRNILKARSPIFSMMLSHDCKESTSGDIEIEDCDPETFENFLRFVYSGRTGNLTPSKALSLYYAGDKYDFPVLREQCVSFMKSSLCTSSVCDVVHLAARHGEQDLLEVATSFFTRHMKEIILTVEWQKFFSMHTTEANELMIKSLRSYRLDDPFDKN